MEIDDQIDDLQDLGLRELDLVLEIARLRRIGRQFLDHIVGVMVIGISVHHDLIESLINADQDVLSEMAWREPVFVSFHSFSVLSSHGR